MRSVIALHAHCRAIVLGDRPTTLVELLPVLKYWQRVRGTGD